MKKNMGTVDRVGRIIFALVIAFLYFTNAIEGIAVLILGVFAIAFISLHSFMEHHLLDIAYNPFILCVFADLSIKKEKFPNMLLNQKKNKKYF